MSEHREPCPRPGLCLDLLGKTDALDRDVRRHETELRDIRTSLVTMQKDLHTLVNQSAGRDRLAHAVLGIFSALLIAGLTQVSVTVWWGSRLQATVEQLATATADHEQRLRSHSAALKHY